MYERFTWLCVVCIASFLLLLLCGFGWYHCVTPEKPLFPTVRFFSGLFTIVLAVWTAVMVWQAHDALPQHGNDTDWEHWGREKVAEGYLKARREASDYLDAEKVKARVADAYDHGKVATLACISDLADEIWDETKKLTAVDDPIGD